MMKFQYNDGGRSRYFSAANVCDCVTRAIAIGANLDYKYVYDEMNRIVGSHKRNPRNASARNGMWKQDYKPYIEKVLGGRWVPTMGIGTGCKVHLRDGELPQHGRIICSCSGHLVAVVDGVLQDTYDSSRDGNRCVYGYWVMKD